MPTNFALSFLGNFLVTTFLVNLNNKLVAINARMITIKVFTDRLPFSPMDIEELRMLLSVSNATRFCLIIQLYTHDRILLLQDDLLHHIHYKCEAYNLCFLHVPLSFQK